MSMLRRYQAPSTGALLTRLFESADLATQVQELPAAALSKVIDHVGLEDAGEIVALATREQLRDVFDEDLWKSQESDAEETFDPQRFALWLTILSEGGDDLVARCLSEMPEELLFLGMERLILVLNMDALTERLTGDERSAEDAEKALGAVTYEEWEEFALVARDAEAWDIVWNCLLTLDRDHHDLLRRLLERCAAISESRLEEEDRLSNLLSEEELLEGVACDARDERRASQGYVSRADAFAFLKLCRMDQDWSVRDPITLAYFRRLQPASTEAPPSSKHSSGQQREGAAQVSNKDHEPLRQLLQDAGAVTAVPIIQGVRKLAAGSEVHARPSLMQLLAELRKRDAVCTQQRLEEITYLANVLLAIAPKEASRRTVDALQGAIALIEQGLSTWPSPAALELGTSSPTQWLETLTIVSADCLFRRGVHAILKSPNPATSPALTPWMSLISRL